MPSPTVVLVHGAFADASSWSAVYPALAAEGLSVLAPPNPLRGMVAGDGEYLTSVVEAIDGPVLLVGHSYGGAVISAAGHADNVVGLVYVAAFAPDESETLAGVQVDFPAPAIGPHIVPALLPGGGAEVSISNAGFREAFCADLPAEEAAFMAIAQRPLFANAFEEPCGAPAWRVRPSWAVLPTADGAIHPETQRFMYARAGSVLTEVPGASHAVALSHPDVVSQVVLTAARASGAQTA